LYHFKELLKTGVTYLNEVYGSSCIDEYACLIMKYVPCTVQEYLEQPWTHGKLTFYAILE